MKKALLFALCWLAYLAAFVYVFKVHDKFAEVFTAAAASLGVLLALIALFKPFKTNNTTTP